MKELTVIVAGHSATGKTTIAREIARHLQSLGLNVEVAPEPDGDDRPDLQAVRLPNLIADKENLRITVQSRHLMQTPWQK